MKRVSLIAIPDNYQVLSLTKVIPEDHTDELRDVAFGRSGMKRSSVTPLAGHLE